MSNALERAVRKGNRVAARAAKRINAELDLLMTDLPAAVPLRSALGTIVPQLVARHLTIMSIVMDDRQVRASYRAARLGAEDAGRLRRSKPG